MKILIADDHAIIREGIKMILTELPEIDEICEAENGLDALRMISGGDFTMAILDICTVLTGNLGSAVCGIVILTQLGEAERQLTVDRR